MQPILTAEEYRRVDQAYKGDLFRAMDRAGHAVSLAAVRAGAGYGKRVVILAGPGNNGGDGYVAARYLKERGAFVTVHALAPPRTPEGIDAAAGARLAGVPVVELVDLVAADVVIDALFGGGVRSGLPEVVLDWMDTTAPVVAVDYPTGLDPDSGTVADAAFRAVETVTFGSIKTGHVTGAGPDFCGVVTIADIGIQGGEPSMFLVEESDALRPSRVRKTHKWSAGAVLVVGGSAGLLGASVLAGRSALNFGAGAVYLASPRVELLQTIAPELPVLELDDAVERLDRFDVVVAGPGLAESDRSVVSPIIAKARRVVLDAGGLHPDILSVAKQGGGDVVVTPHDGEFPGLSGVTAGAYSIRAFASKKQVVVLRKGNPTMVSDGGLPLLVTSGGPELATIGTGDVLAGMIAALWARGLAPVESAVSAAYWHGAAGAALAEHETVTADVLADYVSVYAW